MEMMGIGIWYAAGFAAAAVLVRHGHSPSVVWPAAALIGGLLAAPAVVSVVRRSHAVHHHGPVAPATATGARSAVVALVDADDDGAVADAVGRIRRPGEPVVIVGRVGHEASTRWFDTGERRRVERQLEFAARRIHEPVRSLVSSGLLADVVRDAAADVHPRLVVAPSHGPGRHRRGDLETAAAGLGCPLLFVPVRTSAPDRRAVPA